MGTFKTIIRDGAARKEWYGALRNFTMSTGGLRDKAVSFWAHESFKYDFGKGFRG